MPRGDRTRWPDWLERMPENYARQMLPWSRPAGGVVMRDLDRAAQVFFLLEGTAAAVNVQADGEEYVFASFQPPAVFGEMEAFAQRRWVRGTVVCRTACRGLRMPVEAYLAWLRSDPELLFQRSRAVIRTLTLQARSGRELLFRSARERICLYLLEAAVPCGAGLWEVGETRRQIGDSSGCCEKTVQRELTKLENAGLTALSRGRVRMTEEQMAALRDLVGHERLMEEETP